MNERELEAALRSALRAREPRRAATAKILEEVKRRERRESSQGGMAWRWLAIAAVIVLSCALGLTFWAPKRQDDAAALTAAAQLEEALRISSLKVAQLERRLVVHVNSGVDIGRAESN